LRLERQGEGAQSARANGGKERKIRAKGRRILDVGFGGRFRLSLSFLLLKIAKGDNNSL
jgi:hypothetical protein